MVKKRYGKPCVDFRTAYGKRKTAVFRFSDFVRREKKRINGTYTDPDQRPTTSHLGKFKWPYLREGSSDPLHVWFYGRFFGVGGSNGAISGFAKSKMAARRPSWKIQMAISPRRIVRFIPCSVLGWGFRGRRIEWRYFRFRQIQDGVSATILKNSNGAISAVDHSNGANSGLTKFERYVGENNTRGVIRLVTI